MRRFLLALVPIIACGIDPNPRVVPARGARSGGQTIRIEGDDFVGHGPPVVYVGDHAAKAVVVESRWLITATTPALESEEDRGARTLDVRVVFRDGSTVELPEAFTYEEAQGLVLRPEE